MVNYLQQTSYICFILSEEERHWHLHINTAYVSKAEKTQPSSGFSKQRTTRRRLMHTSLLLFTGSEMGHATVPQRNAFSSFVAFFLNGIAEKSYYIRCHSVHSCRNLEILFSRLLAKIKTLLLNLATGYLESRQHWGNLNSSTAKYIVQETVLAQAETFKNHPFYCLWVGS